MGLSQRSGWRLLVVAGAVALASLAGCAYSPYVNWATPALEPGAPITLQAAINHAYMAKSRYEQALDEETRRQTSLSNGLIVLGAAALGFAVAKGRHGSDVARLGLIGGTAYTLGTWNSSKPRDDIYLETAIAMTCAVDAIQPLNIDEVEKRAFERALDGLDARIAAVVHDTANLEVEIGRAPNADATLLASAGSDVTAAKTIADAANDVSVAGTKLRRQRSGAGAALMNAVNSIGALVNKALGSTVPDLSALPGVIKGLAASTAVVAPGLNMAGVLADRMGAATKGTSGQIQMQAKGLVAPPFSTLEIAIGTLKLSAAELVSYARRIGAQIENSNAGQPLEKLKACKVDVDTDITVSPAQVVFTAKDTSTKRVVVSGGKKPYVARVLDTPAPIDVHSPIAGDSVVEIVGTDKLAAGNRYSVTIMDAANHSKTVTVLVQAADAAGGAAGGTRPKATPTAPGRPAADVAPIQSAVCVKADGIVGPKTLLAVKVFQVEVGETPDGNITDAQFKILQDQLKKRGECAKDRANFYEGSLSTDDINTLRKLLLKPDDSANQIDDPMRAAIKAAQIDLGKDPRGLVAANAKAQGQLTSLLKTGLVWTGVKK